MANVMAMISAPTMVTRQYRFVCLDWYRLCAGGDAVAEALLFGTWANGIAFVLYTLLQAQGRPNVVAKFHALEIVPFVIILIGRLLAFGLTGASTAWAIRAVVECILLLDAAGNVRASLTPMAPAGLIMVATLAFATFVAPPAFPAITVALALGSTILFYVVASDSLVRSNVKRPLKFRGRNIAKNSGPTNNNINTL